MNKTKAAAGLVLRYLTVSALVGGRDWEIPANLEYRIAGGIRALPGGIVLNEVALVPEPAIIYDRKDPDFWTAIIGGDDTGRRAPPGLGDEPMKLLERKAGGRVAVSRYNLLRLGDGHFERGRRFMHGLIVDIRRRR